MNSASVISAQLYRIAAMASRRAPIAGRYTAEEVALAARNRGMPLEALRHELTPPGLHYLLIHFDIPAADDSAWRLSPRSFPKFTFARGGGAQAHAGHHLARHARVRGQRPRQLAPRYPSVPWLEEGVSTADWTGVPLAALLQKASPQGAAREIVSMAPIAASTPASSIISRAVFPWPRRCGPTCWSPTR